MADIDTISILLTQNIGDIDIDILYRTAALFGLPIYFIIASKVVYDVSVIP